MQARPNSRVIGSQRIIRKCRKITPNHRVDLIHGAPLQAVIDFVDPLLIGPESAAHREIERKDSALAPDRWIRDDQATKGRFPSQLEECALCQLDAGNALLLHALDVACHLCGPEARCIDQLLTLDP